MSETLFKELKNIGIDEIHTTSNRQCLVTFGCTLLTIATVLAVNWYFNV